MVKLSSIEFLYTHAHAHTHTHTHTHTHAHTHTHTNSHALSVTITGMLMWILCYVMVMKPSIASFTSPSAEQCLLMLMKLAMRLVYVRQAPMVMGISLDSAFLHT